MIMRRCLLFIFITFLLMACDPKLFTVDFTNNAGYQLIGMFDIGGNENNTAKIILSQGDGYFVLAESLGSLESTFYAMFPNGIMQLKLYNSEILVCNSEYNDELDKCLLQEYEISFDDLEKLGWHLYYPPTPEMKDIKMWPPYEEVIKQHDKRTE